MAKILENLFDIQEKALQNNETCISIYHNINNPSKNIIQTEIRNLIIGYSRQFGFENEKSSFRNIADIVSDIIFNYDIYKNSIAIFLTLNLNEQIEHENIVINKNLFIISSELNIVESGYIGQVFDLSTAIKLINNNYNNLVINITWDKILLFKSEGSDFKKIHEIENKILEAMEERYTGMYTTGENSLVHQGSAIDEKNLKFTQTILNNLYSELKNLEPEYHNNQVVLVFYTPDFANHKENIINEIKKYSQKAPLALQKILKLEENIKSEAKKELDDNMAASHSQELEELKTSIAGDFVQDWENVCEAARNARIHKIYIKEGVKEPGYILNNDLPYIEMETGSIPTDYILPWIIRKVYQTSGEVTILDPQDQNLEFPIAAKLRF